MPKCDFSKVASGNGYSSVNELFSFSDIIIVCLLWAAVFTDTGEPVEINTYEFNHGAR